MFSSEGGAATLPCNNVMVHSPNCSSTTWIYYNSNYKTTVEVVTLGKVNSGSNIRFNKLSLLPNCSLQVTDVSTEDAGLYTCRQYVNGNKSREDVSVYHLVLHSKCALMT